MSERYVVGVEAVNKPETDALEAYMNLMPKFQAYQEKLAELALATCIQTNGRILANSFRTEIFFVDGQQVTRYSVVVLGE